MIEVAAALSAATTAFNANKKGFEVGRDIESMSGDLSRWMGAASDIDKAGEYAKKPPLFKKYLQPVQLKKRRWHHSWLRRKPRICVINLNNLYH